MTLFGITSYIALLLVVVTAFLPIRKAYAVLILCAPLTTIAIIGIENNNILIYHLIWLVFTIKFLVVVIQNGHKLNLALVPFLLVTALSIPLAVINGDTMVVNVNSQFAYVKLSFQQITQWLYLLIAISTAIESELLLREGYIDKEYVLKFLDIGMFVVLGLALLQLVVPADVFTTYFRNSVHAGYTHVGGRISSTFQEPSMLSLYLLPLVAMHLKRLISSPNVKSVILIALSLYVCVLNNSSAAFLGLIVAVTFVIFVEVKAMFTERFSGVKVLCLLFFVLMVLAMLNSGLFSENIDHMIEKVNGGGVSGAERLLWIEHTWNVFLTHPFIGIGWGTTRCAVIVCWLSELGIVGCLFIFVPLLVLAARLWKGKGLSHELLAYIVTVLALYVFVSSEIYYLTLWIVIGLAMYETSSAARLADEDKEAVAVASGEEETADEVSNELAG